jgi:hypothetical protein
LALFSRSLIVFWNVCTKCHEINLNMFQLLSYKGDQLNFNILFWFQIVYFPEQNTRV